MSLEPVVREQAAEVGIAFEDDAVEIPRLALEPAGAAPDPGDGRDGRLFAGRNLEADPLVVLEAQQVDDDFEALLALRIVDAAEIDQHAEEAFRVVVEEAAHAHQLLA